MSHEVTRHYNRVDFLVYFDLSPKPSANPNITI